MGARLAVTGSILAGLAAVGGIAAAEAFQPPATRLVQPVRGGTSVLSPKQFTTYNGAPTTAAPVPAVSTQAPARAGAPSPKVAPVAVKPVAPAPTQGPQLAGHYYDGTPVAKDAAGNVITLPKPVDAPGNAPTTGGQGNPGPTPTP